MAATSPLSVEGDLPFSKASWRNWRMSEAGHDKAFNSLDLHQVWNIAHL